MTSDLVDPAALQIHTEADLLRQVLELATTLGWLHHHDFEQKNYGRRSMKGFPDLVLVRGRRLIFAELKSDKKSSKPSPDQEIWLEALREVARYWVDMEVYLWRPRDWPEIVEELQADGAKPEVTT